MTKSTRSPGTTPRRSRTPLGSVICPLAVSCGVCIAAFLGLGTRLSASSPAAPGTPQPLPQGLVEDRRRRRGDVERVEAAPHRQADRRVAEGAGPNPQAALLTPEAE